ncbi:MAG: adenylate/guanylate cyclase domain-containing protein [Leptospiraceae bacterium]|nr:adenylate/guanylate cyclase domain-containing protein [Leptospiraceae bacterium]MCP5512559.1 adenylate/guanylate cyclase domain-containing protein [Leptospiraceae bacterium]
MKFYTDTKSILPNTIRIVANFFVVLFFSYQLISSLYVLLVINFFFSIAWALSEYYLTIPYQTRPIFRYLPMISDVVVSILLVYVTGNHHSFFLIVFPIIVLLSTLYSTDGRQGYLSYILIVISYGIMLVLVALDIFPQIPLLSNPQNINLLRFLSFVVVTFATFGVYKIIRITIFEFQRDIESYNVLLKNFLPKFAIQNIKSGVIPKPEYYNNVVILILQLDGLDEISKKVPSSKVFQELNLYLTKIDEVLEIHNIYKYRSIGGMLICVAGLSKNNRAQIIETVKVASKLSGAISDINAIKQSANSLTLGLKIALHSGDVFAGMTGNNHLNFELIGDSISTCTRLIEMTDIGKITISETLLKVIEPHFVLESKGTYSKSDSTNLKYFELTGEKSK